VIFIERQRDPRRERSGYLRASRHPARAHPLPRCCRSRAPRPRAHRRPPGWDPSEPTLSFISRPPKSAQFISVNQFLRPQTDADHLRHQPARAPLAGARAAPAHARRA
jgi:hypothetical protein